MDFSLLRLGSIAGRLSNGMEASEEAPSPPLTSKHAGKLNKLFP